MRYLMLTNAKGATDENGTATMVYRQGETYHLPKAVAEAFVEAGYANPADEVTITSRTVDAESGVIITDATTNPAAPGPSATKPAKPSKKKA